MDDIEEMDREMEKHRISNQVSEEADIKQFLAYAAGINSGITEAEKEWHILCIKNGSLV